MSVSELEEALEQAASPDDAPSGEADEEEAAEEPEPVLEGQETLWIDVPGEWHEVERAEEPRTSAGAGARRANHGRVTPPL